MNHQPESQLMMWWLRASASPARTTPNSVRTMGCGSSDSARRTSAPNTPMVTIKSDCAPARNKSTNTQIASTANWAFVGLSHSRNFISCECSRREGDWFRLLLYRFLPSLRTISAASGFLVAAVSASHRDVSDGLRPLAVQRKRGPDQQKHTRN
jgi:hypothetical protein